jgi:glutamate synthase (ferredoxin)
MAAVAFSTPSMMGRRSFLKMAFDSSKPSNMFEGPAPLLKERDACGVGFIANTQSGGKNQ